MFGVDAVRSHGAAAGVLPPKRGGGGEGGLRLLLPRRFSHPLRPRHQSATPSCRVPICIPVACSIKIKVMHSFILLPKHLPSPTGHQHPPVFWRLRAAETTLLSCLLRGRHSMSHQHTGVRAGRRTKEGTSLEWREAMPFHCVFV